jgi:hypothetical protein
MLIFCLCASRLDYRPQLGLLFERMSHVASTAIYAVVEASRGEKQTAKDKHIDNSSPDLFPSSSTEKHRRLTQVGVSLYDCQISADLLLIHYGQVACMVLTCPHSFISDGVNVPATLCHFLYIPQKLIPCFSLKHS